MQLDGNLHAGKEIVPNDPNPQNENGKLFHSYLERNPEISMSSIDSISVNVSSQGTGRLSMVKRRLF
jgi:hypothetical protein